MPVNRNPESAPSVTPPRLFVDADLVAGCPVAATAEQAHYLGGVMRRSAGDPIVLFNGRDGEWQGTIESIRKDRAQFQPTTQIRIQTPEPGPWLVFALLKRDSTDLVVQKATELGASALLPVLTERTNAGRVNEARLHAIALEAAEQCERLTIPTIHAPARLHAILDLWPAERPLFAAVERQNAQPLPPDPDAGLLVGPEGGFSRVELDALRGYSFVTPITLGPRVLRAETACIAGLALLQALPRS